MFTEDEIKLMNEYEEKYGYNPMMQYAFYFTPSEIINLLIEADGREIIMISDNERKDYAKASFK